VNETLEQHPDIDASEIEEVLASFGARAEISSVEKVLVRGEAGERVPFDAVVWLRLTPQ
jgi:hypothetical protein